MTTINLRDQRVSRRTSGGGGSSSCGAQLTFSLDLTLPRLKESSSLMVLGRTDGATGVGSSPLVRMRAWQTIEKITRSESITGLPEACLRIPRSQARERVECPGVCSPPRVLTSTDGDSLSLLPEALLLANRANSSGSK